MGWGRGGGGHKITEQELVQDSEPEACGPSVTGICTGRTHTGSASLRPLVVLWAAETWICVFTAETMVSMLKRKPPNSHCNAASPATWACGSSPEGPGRGQSQEPGSLSSVRSPRGCAKGGLDTPWGPPCLRQIRCTGACGLWEAEHAENK